MVKQLRAVAVAVLAVALLVPVAAAATSNPVVLSVSPQTVIAGTGAFTLRVNGANFINGSVVLLNSSGRLTHFVSSTQLDAEIESSDTSTAGSLSVAVINPGTNASTAVQLQVLPNNPQITSLSPNTLPVNSSTLDVTVNGQNFDKTAVVRLTGSARSTTYVSATQLTVHLTATDVNHTTFYNVTVLNPNNVLSNQVTLNVTGAAQAPAITALNPPSVVAGSGAFTLGVVGTNFVNGSTVRVDGTDKTTTFVDATHLTAQLSALDVSQAGNRSITVRNPNAQVSTAATLTITSGTTPTVTSLSPSTVVAGAPTFTLSITGTNFVSGSKVNVGSQTGRTATFVDAQHLNVTITPSDTLNTSQVPISVTNPAPNGGTSNSVSLFISSVNAPTLTSLSPSSIATSTTNFKVLVNGSGFLIDDIILLDGDPRTTEYISASQLALTLQAKDVAAAGTHQVSVKRKDNSGTSAPLTLTVVAADVPAILNVTPSQANVNSPALQIDVFGQNFVNDALVEADQVPLTTSFISATELIATLPADEFTSAHDIALTVVTPSNGTSGTFLFHVLVPVPTITGLEPSSVIAGDADFQLKVTGSNFTPASSVKVNGVSRPTQLQTATGALLASITAADITAPGTLQITVTDNGVTSAPATLTVRPPTISSVEPGTLVLGSPSAILTVQGDAFLTTSKIVYKGTERTTTYNASDGSLSTTLAASDLADAGMFAVSVRNSPSAISTPVLVQVEQGGPPRIDAIFPNEIVITSPPDSLLIYGVNFFPDSVVKINGSPRATTYISSTQLQAALTVADHSQPATLVVTIANPDGLTSVGVNLQVVGTATIPPRRRSARP